MRPEAPYTHSPAGFSPAKLPAGARSGLRIFFSSRLVVPAPISDTRRDRSSRPLQAGVCHHPVKPFPCRGHPLLDHPAYGTPLCFVEMFLHRGQHGDGKGAGSDGVTVAMVLQADIIGDHVIFHRFVVGQHRDARFPIIPGEELAQ